MRKISNVIFSMLYLFLSMKYSIYIFDILYDIISLQQKKQQYG